MRIRNLVIYVMFSFVICMSACNNVSEENVSAETSMEVNQSESVESEENELADDVVADEQEEVEISVSFKEKVFSDAYSYEEKDEFAFEYMSACAKEMSPSIHLLPFDEVGEYERSEAEPLSEIDIPEYVTVIALYKGDIGLDGVEEIALVMEIYVQGEDESDFFDADGQRMLILYREKEDGTYEYWKENRGVVAAKYEGGMMGDAFSGIQIKDGELCVYSYGGSSSDRWSYDYFFNLRDGELMLERMEWTELCTLNANMIKGTVFYEEGREVTYAYPGCDTENKILYSEETFEPFINSFEESVSYGTTYPDFDYRGPMPYVPRLDFDGTMGYHASTWDVQPAQNADAVLDEIMNAYYPDMTRVEIGYSDEVISNRVEFLGYEFPTYYYEDDKGNSLYYKRMSQERTWEGESGACVVHVIYYTVMENGKLVYAVRYEVNDATGEIIWEEADYVY